MKVFSTPFYLLVLLSLSLVFAPAVVRSEDAAEEEVELDEDAVLNEGAAAGGEEATASAEAEEDLPVNSLSSPFAKTNILFVKPESSDLPAGRLARVLISFQNNASDAFLVEGIDGSLRFPQDYSYYIQNFTNFEFNKVVEAQHESTFEFMFTPSETFSQRQFGLVISLRYKDMDSKSFINSVFNETITIVEPDEGFDGETFFLYIFLAAIVVLLGLAANHFFSIFTKKSKLPRFGGSSARAQTNGSANGVNKDVDFAWIPKEHLPQNKSPRTSPRQRSARNATGGASSTDEQ